MKTTGRVNGIISNIVIVKADGAVAQNEICYVYAGDTRMMAEVIKVIGDAAYVQVFDSTRGLKIGDRVEFEGHMLEATLGPLPLTGLVPERIGAVRRLADGGEVVRGESWVTNAYENLAFVTFGTIPQYTYPLPDPIDTVLEIEYNE